MIFSRSRESGKLFLPQRFQLCGMMPSPVSRLRSCFALGVMLLGGGCEGLFPFGCHAFIMVLPVTLDAGSKISGAKGVKGGQESSLAGIGWFFSRPRALPRLQ